MVAAAALALVAFPAGWYFGSPWWTLWRIREAARAGDSARLASYVDHRAIAAQWAAEARVSWTSVLDMVRPDTPEGRDFIALAKRQLARRPSGTAGKEGMRAWLASIPIGFGGGDEKPYIVRDGLDRFEVRDRGASLETGPVLTFRRHGLGWKLEAVRWGQQ